MHRTLCIAATSILLAGCGPTSGKGGTQQPIMTRPALGTVAHHSNVADILGTYAAAWRGVEEFDLKAPYTIVFWVDGSVHTVRLDAHSAALSVGEPSSYDWGFETDLATLQAIHSGQMNALTAMGQARSSDPIPLQPKLPDNFDGTQVRGHHIPLLQKFWNREWPETVPFGDGATRQIHGANTTVLIYDEGLRTAWYQLKPGMHINADPSDQVNTFDTAIIVTRGQFTGIVGGVARLFKEGETVRIPEGVTHEFHADPDQYGEFVIVMWGDDA